MMEDDDDFIEEEEKMGEEPLNRSQNLNSSQTFKRQKTPRGIEESEVF